MALPSTTPSPAQAIQQSINIVTAACEKLSLNPQTDLTVIGSSLGGYYANYLAEYWQCRAVVLNPSVQPMQTLQQYVGQQKYYHSNQDFEFKPEYLDELAALAPSRPTDPKRYYLLACKGDEVLDWRDMASWYQGSHGRILEGGNHSISEFERWMPEVLEFALLKNH